MNRFTIALLGATVGFAGASRSSAQAAVIASAQAAGITTANEAVLTAHATVVTAHAAAVELSHPAVTTPATKIVAPEDTLTSQFEVAGIPVILRRVLANDVVAANLYLLGGSRQLTRQNAGIELMLLEASEHGTAKYPRDVLRAKMARLGSAIGVGPGIDWTTMSVRATSSGFDSTWAILADRLAAPTLAPQEVELVREQFVTAARQRKDSPDALLDYLADSIAYTGQPYSIDPFGSEESLSRLSVADLKAYRSEQIVSARMMLVVVGNISRSRVEKLVRETLGRLPKGNYVWQVPSVPAPLPSAFVVERRNLPTNYIQGYYQGPSATSKDYNALRLASAVLSGRLFSEVRSRNNLSYSVNAPFEERAFAVGGLYVTTVYPDRVLDIMKDQVTALQEGYITADGLERLVQQFIVTYFLDNETNADQANMLARAALYQGDYRRASQFVDNLRAVTPEDIRNAARKYMKNLRWAYVGDPTKVSTAKLLKF